MTGNSIDKECPVCHHTKSEIHAAIIQRNEKKEEISYNKYSCLKCHVGFLVQRKGNPEEQQLTEEFIKSEHIVLDD